MLRLTSTKNFCLCPTLPRLFRFALFSLAPCARPWSARRGGENRIPGHQPASAVKQRVGLTDIEVDYSRPNKNDREIFGGLVPYGKVWRTGANATTKIKFSGPVKLGRQRSPRGRIRPLHHPGRGRVDASSFRKTRKCRAPPITRKRTTPPASRPSPPRSPAVETFTIGFADVKGAVRHSASRLGYDARRRAVETDDVEKVSQQLEAAAKSSTPLEPRMAYSAAVFYSRTTRT